ncbi:MAG: hypothetical protein IKR74_01590 [Bacilli bacterium]|nr:hypothetical protein [Bacilli bacterium]
MAKYKRLNYEKDEDMRTFYAKAKHNFIIENADRINTDSFVYLYALSDEERALVDEIRKDKELQRVLRKINNNEEIN